jgi:hypothetical protein
MNKARWSFGGEKNAGLNDDALGAFYRAGEAVERRGGGHQRQSGTQKHSSHWF